MRFATFSSDGRRYLHPESLPKIQCPSLSPFTSIAKLPDFDAPPRDEHFRYSTSLQRTLQGKLLLLNELPFSIEFIHTHYVRGYLGYMKSIVKRSDGYICQRCGNEEQRLFSSFFCARCGEDCTYCRKCIIMGRVSECLPLVYWRHDEQAPIRTENRTLMNWEGELSPEQAKASQVVIDTIVKRGRQLVWAVCGAGKTELLFEGLAYAFETGLCVCIATPRVDVVLELEPRLRSVFPTVRMTALYGGAAREVLECQLFISTTHQLLRYRHAFDVVIVDEVDAFPYSYDPMLAFAVERAKKKVAATILLTATPDEELKQRVEAGSLSAIKIPIRYHRHPLPVPHFVWCGNWNKKLVRKCKLPNVVFKWCRKRMEHKQPFLLFVPSVIVAEQVKVILGVESVYAEDTDRKEKVEKFRRGEMKALVTTTILERGVTIPRLNVAVLGSEHDIFTESALVQIAGRVGRSADFPNGDVCFFHYGKTKAMVAARQHILEMNKSVR